MRSQRRGRRGLQTLVLHAKGFGDYPQSPPLGLASLSQTTPIDGRHSPLLQPTRDQQNVHTGSAKEDEEDHRGRRQSEPGTGRTSGHDSPLFSLFCVLCTLRLIRSCPDCPYLFWTVSGTSAFISTGTRDSGCHPGNARLSTLGD